MEGQRIADIRRTLGSTQIEFAETIGAPPATVRHWEQERRSPSGAAETLLRLIEIDPKTMGSLLRRVRAKSGA